MFLRLEKTEQKVPEDEEMFAHKAIVAPRLQKALAQHQAATGGEGRVLERERGGPTTNESQRRDRLAPV